MLYIVIKIVTKRKRAPIQGVLSIPNDEVTIKPPEYEPIAIPILKAAILIPEATSSVPGNSFSAICTTKSCNPGTVANDNPPKKKSVIILKTGLFTVK